VKTFGSERLSNGQQTRISSSRAGFADRPCASGNQQTRISSSHVGFADRQHGDRNQQTRILTPNVGFADCPCASGNQQTRISTRQVGFADRGEGDGDQQTRISGPTWGLLIALAAGVGARPPGRASSAHPEMRGCRKAGRPCMFSWLACPKLRGCRSRIGPACPEMRGCRKFLSRNAGLSKNPERPAFDIPAFWNTGGRFPCKAGSFFDKPALVAVDAGFADCSYG
jgi:hypothetical protein